MTIPTTRLNDGRTMPRFGLGVFQTPPAETQAAVTEALRQGYRLIDTAAAYGNEREVGAAIRASGVARDAIFVETKIWISDYGLSETRHGFNKSFRKLDLGPLDLVLLHQPFPAAFERTIGAWKALEQLQAEGAVKSIGVSNFMPEHLTRLLDVAKVVPAVNQIEIHPYFQQADLQALNAAHGIRNQAWSPMGGITFYRGGARGTLQDPVIGAIAARLGKSPAQVMLRWHIEAGRDVIPKSVNPARIAENLAIFDFALTPEDRAAIDGLETGKRGGPEPAAITLESFVREIPDA